MPVLMSTLEITADRPWSTATSPNSATSTTSRRAIFTKKACPFAKRPRMVVSFEFSTGEVSPAASTAALSYRQQGDFRRCRLPMQRPVNCIAR